ncbi:hypothetical protein [Bacillus gobiensis]|uniref:hypothetical protein n=1 Tax=Bacillus gobiensis TaxID=1441095 RepID=UPI003D1AD574
MTEKITLEHSNLAFDFLNKVRGEDVEAYWDLICKVDQARVYGMYRAFMLTKYFDGRTFYDYVKNDFMIEHAKNFEGITGEPGISDRIRYTEQGDILLYLLNDVQVPRVYIAKTEARVFPLTITLDCTYIDNELNAQWKVRIYQDKFHETLEEQEIEFPND